MLRLRIGEGLTGWVAEHNETIRLGDAGADPRGLQVGTDHVAESMLLVPMSYESRVLGVIVVSKAGFDQFGEDDQRTLEIFAGYAAQARGQRRGVRAGPAPAATSSTTGSRASAACSRSTSACSPPSTRAACSR